MSYTNDNKLVGDIRDVFKPNQERWDRHELEIISDINDEYLRKSRKVDEFYDELKKKLDLKGIGILPHQKSIEVILFDCRKLILDIFEIVSNNENPYNHIVSSQQNIFSFMLILIISGVILFLMSSFLID